MKLEVRSTRIAAACGALLAVSGITAGAQSAGPPPAEYTGTWSGTNSQNFGLANGADPLSYECFQPSTLQVQRPQTLRIGADGSVVLGAMGRATATGDNNKQYVVNGEAERTFTWISLQNSDKHLVQLRNSSGIIECHYLDVTGSGSSKKLTMITIGGDDFSRDWQLQCNPSYYSGTGPGGFDQITTKPQCVPRTPGGVVAGNNTVLRTFQYTGGGVNAAGGVLTSAVAALTALGAAAAALLA